MKKTILTFSLVLVSIFSTLYAQSGAKLSIQGVLRNANGTAVENGKYDLIFRLWDSPTNGNQIWMEEKTKVDVEGGIYSVVLGDSDTPLNASFTEEYYLGVAIEGGTELIPRATLTSSPYALSLIGSDNIFPNSGNVGVGAANPQHKLTVQRGNGILGLEASEEANNTSTITTTTEGIEFDAGGSDKFYAFSNGKVQATADQQFTIEGTNEANLLLSKDAGNAKLGFDPANGNDLLLSNAIGETKVEGHKIILNSSNEPVEINRDGEALKLIGSDASFLSFSAPADGTNANAQMGFLNSDTLRIETAGQDVIVDAKGGTTRVMNTLEVGVNGVNTYIQEWGSYMSRWSHNGNSIAYIGSNHEDKTAIWAYDDVAAVLFKAISDKRIKKDFQQSNARNDLETLKQIEVTDYRHIDEIKHGPAFRKGLIAQQLKTVFPEAVSLSTKHIPNIYTLSSTVKTEGDKVTISLGKTHGLKANDQVKIMTEKGEENMTVENVVNEFSFTVAPQKIKISESVFVYGKEVDDFHTVDYDRVFTLAVSATQELIRKVEALEKENASLKEQTASVNQSNHDLATKMKSLNLRLESIELMLNATGSKE